MPSTYIAGIVKQHGLGKAGLRVLALTLNIDPIEGVRLVLGQTLSGPGGAYQVVVSSGYTDHAIVIAIDEEGEPWAASQALAVGERVYQEPFDGILYTVTVAGDSGASAPDWTALGAAGGGTLGTAITEKITYLQPLASGPVLPSATGV
jgi:hypothetical protein